MELVECKEEKRAKLPLHPLRNIIDRHYKGQVSTEAVVKLREILEEIAHKMAEEAVEQHNELNKNREKQGLRRLQRLNRWDVKNSYYNLDFKYNEKNIVKGSQGAPQGFENPGDNMSAQTDVTKPGNTTDDRDREVA